MRTASYIIINTTLVSSFTLPYCILYVQQQAEMRKLEMYVHCIRFG